MNNPLEIKNLCVNLGRREVLRDVNLTLLPGSFTGLVGPNGAGKTTLLRSILGLIPTRSGSIIVAGEQGKKAKQKLGYVPQRHEFAWEFPIDVRGVVMTGRTREIGWLRQPKKHDYEAVYRALEIVQLTDLSRRPISELSGGQRQRVLLARSLATSPEVLLLDEPFTGLDMPSQELLLDLFQKLAASGVSLLMSTHDLGSAMDLCSHLVLLNRRVRATGTPEEVSDPRLWMETFNVSASSPLLRTVGVRA